MNWLKIETEDIRVFSPRVSAGPAKLYTMVITIVMWFWFGCHFSICAKIYNWHQFTLFTFLKDDSICIQYHFHKKQCKGISIRMTLQSRTLMCSFWSWICVKQFVLMINSINHHIQCFLGADDMLFVGTRTPKSLIEVPSACNESTFNLCCWVLAAVLKWRLSLRSDLNVCAWFW